MKARLHKAIEETLSELGIDAPEFVVEHPADMSHGDYASNVAMAAEGNPRELAEKIKKELEKQNIENVDKIEVAGPGFINFHLSRDFFTQSLQDIIDAGDDFGKNDALASKKVMVEYTDPNPFKEFHIGHLMNNAIGEALSRLVEWSGATTKRANYQGDVGVHVAKAIWGKMDKPDVSWGEAYAHGARAYEKEAKDEVDALNKKIYERSDEKINELYDEGKKVTLAEFEKIYETLGTNFDYYFFESEVAKPGKELVEEHVGEVFEKSEGAVIFHEEKSGLHTRVFINSQDIPTYEAKELGLAHLKYKTFSFDESITITAVEQRDYFAVVLKALEHINPELSSKIKHIAHGMLRLPGGKMSSRTGEVISAASLIATVKEEALSKMDIASFSDAGEAAAVARQIAVGALKYAILKQAPGKDIIFDKEKALSLEGDSGPYLQYTLVRAQSVLAKGAKEEIMPDDKKAPDTAYTLEKILYRFTDVVESAQTDDAPQHVVTYLTDVASTYNAFYADERIADADDPLSPYKLLLTEAVATTLRNGLAILAIPTPKKM